MESEKIKDGFYLSLENGRKPGTLRAAPYIIVGSSENFAADGTWLSMDEARALDASLSRFLKKGKEMEKDEPKPEPKPEAPVPAEEAKDEKEKRKSKAGAKKSTAPVV